VGDLHWYGGDAQIVATRGEIERVIAELTGLENWLQSQLEPQDFLVEPLERLRLALELPPVLERIGHIRNACIAASDSYFTGEIEISKELRSGNRPPVPELALGLIGAGNLLGLFGETSVKAQIVQVDESVAPPRSIHGLGERLASTAKVADGWLRIEKYFEPASPVTGLPGEAKYLVYIPGTQSWAPNPAGNPLDVTSNLGAISKTGSAGSERAVALALKQAGVQPNSRVLFIGHSQGGMLAANLSLTFPRSSVLTFGAPIGQLTEKLKAQVLAIEHDLDAVPKVDGRANPMRENWVTVRQDIPSAKATDPIGQHQMKGYLETAAAIDAENGSSKPESSAMTKMRDSLAGFAGKEPGTAIYFELTRQT